MTAPCISETGLWDRVQAQAPLCSLPVFAGSSGTQGDSPFPVWLLRSPPPRWLRASTEWRDWGLQTDEEHREGFCLPSSGSGSHLLRSEIKDAFRSHSTFREKAFAGRSERLQSIILWTFRPDPWCLFVMMAEKYLRSSCVWEVYLITQLRSIKIIFY